MGTNSFIAIEDPDGSVRFIYCSVDGYFKHMVPIFKMEYITRESVNTLINKGGIISLSYREEPMKPNEWPMETESDRWEFEEE